jgi:hypothetical protein
METDSSLATDKKPPKLRWYQYTLRSLLLLTLLVAIGMSYVGVMIRDGRRQKAAAEAIKKLRGYLTTEATA